MTVKILPGTDKLIFSTTKRTGIPQREKLEMVMKNLCTTLGAKTIYRMHGARGETYYRVDGVTVYESASNIILQMSEMLADKHKD